MINNTVAGKIRTCRKDKGLSQESLAEKASINLRTLQRIENNQTEPRGHTLRLIAEVLEKPLEYFTTDKDTGALKPDRKFLQVLNLSGLFFWIFPFGNIIVPWLLWHIYKDKIKGADELGKKVINFQATWSLITYSLLFAAILLTILHPGTTYPFWPLYFIALVGILYIFNVILIIVTAFQISHGRRLIFLRGFKLMTATYFICLIFEAAAT